MTTNCLSLTPICKNFLFILLNQFNWENLAWDLLPCCLNVLLSWHHLLNTLAISSCSSLLSITYFMEVYWLVLDLCLMEASALLDLVWTVHIETRLMQGCWSQMHEDLSHNPFCSCVTDYLRGLWKYTYKSFDGKTPNTLSGLNNQKITKSVSSSWEDNCLHGGLMNRMHILVWFTIIILYLFCLCQHQFVKEKCNFLTRL